MTDVTSLQATLQNASITSGSIIMPTGLQWTLTSSINAAGGASNFTLNGSNGMLLGNNSFALIDMGTQSVNAIQNIELNRGTSSAAGGAFSAGTIAAGINNTAFRNNQAATNGGAVYISGAFAGGIQNNIHFDSNTASGGSGGGIYIGGNFSGGIGGSGQDAHFDNNHASADGGGMYVGGTFSGNISTNYFATNTADGSGGGLYVGGALDGVLSSYAFFINNTAGVDGGGLYVTGALGNSGNAIDGAIVTGNTAKNNGGGIWTGSLAGNVTANFAQNTATNGSGGAIYVNTGDITGNINNAQFTSNTAGANGGGLHVANGGIAGSINNSNFSQNAAGGSGGAINLQGSLTGSISGANFTQNTAGANGGGFNVVSGGIAGDISNTTFTGNRANANGGGFNIVSGNIGGSLSNVTFSQNIAAANGGGFNLSQGNITGDISGTSFATNSAGQNGGGLSVMNGDISGTLSNSPFAQNSATASGGGMYVSGTVGNITNMNFSANHAGQHGGAAFIGTLNNGISNSTLNVNTANGNGGALYIDQGLNGTILNTQFLLNTAGGYGGAIFVNTSSTTGSTNFTLSADGDNRTTFTGNYSAATGQNSSIYFGRANGQNSGHDVFMNIGGADFTGTVAIYDPITVDMTGGRNFTYTNNGGTGTHYWGGRNNITTVGGTATFNLNAGTTQLRPDFTLVAGSGTRMIISMGAGPEIKRFSMDVSQRDANLAVFNFANAAAGSSFTLGSNLVLTAPRTLLPQVGKYLMVEGGIAALPDQAALDHVNGSIEETHEYQAQFLREGNQIWLTTVYVPDHVTDLGPNGEESLGNIEDWLHNTENGNKVLDNDWAFYLLKNDLNSVSPEAALTLGWINTNNHIKVANQALDMAFESCREQNPSTKDDDTNRLNCERKEFYAWVSYLGSFGQDARSRREHSGYRVDTNGIVMGLNWNFRENWTAGVYGSYTRSDTNFTDIHASSQTEAGQFGLFARYTTPENMRLTVDAAYSHHKNDLRRSPAYLGVSEGDYAHDVFSVGAEIAQDFYPWDSHARLTPFASARYLWINQQGFTETGGMMNAHVSRTDHDFLTTNLGATLERDYTLKNGTVLTPGFTLAWRHNFGNSQFSTRARFAETYLDGSYGPTYQVKSRPQERDALVVGLGLKAEGQLRPGVLWNTTLSYTREQSSRSSDDALFLSVGLRF